VATSHLLILLALAGALLAIGVRLARAWPAIAGIAVAAFVAFGHLTARFGPAQLWFRAPTFYVALALLVVGTVWWLRRPLPKLLRFGALAACLALVGAALALILLDGRGAPPSMLLPTGNRAAPDFAFEDASGRTRRLSDLKGDVVLINFWATWCVPCRREMPMLAKMQREYEPKRFRVLFISLEDADVLSAFRTKHRFDGIQGRLDAAPPFYDAGKYYPLSYLVNREGRVVARWSGRPGEGWLSETIERQL
jgi:thiol-disulfide isomerase/thioredoxin